MIHLWLTTWFSIILVILLGQTCTHYIQLTCFSRKEPSFAYKIAKKITQPIRRSLGLARVRYLYYGAGAFSSKADAAFFSIGLPVMGSWGEKKAYLNLSPHMIGHGHLVVTYMWPTFCFLFWPTQNKTQKVGHMYVTRHWAGQSKFISFNYLPFGDGGTTSYINYYEFF